MRNGYVVFVVLVAMMGATRALEDVMSEEIGGLIPDSLIPRAPGPGVCTDQKYFHCQVRFNRALGFTDDNDFRNPEILYFLVNRVLRAGIDGLASVCAARQEFQECLGDAYYACLDPLYYLRHHIGRDRAVLFLSIFQSMEWKCVGGFQEGIRNWPCIIRAFDEQHDRLELCFSKFNASVHANPSLYCRAGGTMLACSRDAIFMTCHYNGEAQWWACNDLTRGFLLDSCMIPCPVSHGANPEEVLQLGGDTEVDDIDPTHKLA